MQLIKKLDRRKSKTGNSYQSWGLFWCSFCEREVEKHLGPGKRDKSCGCSKNDLISDKIIKHGEINTRLYVIWGNMKQRCLNPNYKHYKDWGGRGITICDEWLEYISFRDWALNNGYQEDLEINRINNDGNYEPYNCNFITSKENTQHRRSSKLTLEKANEIRELYKTGKYTRKQLAEIYNVSRALIGMIINNKIWKN